MQYASSHMTIEIEQQPAKIQNMKKHLKSLKQGDSELVNKSYYTGLYME